ncbi:MAG: MmcQ/YjbR family DNA-binding protein [Myxococcales bacterium]|nr:MmcQ/YjbR family DNA-binding protein [Myxococcales bacterium]
MTADEFNSYCRSLPATTHVVQWGGSDVWKVGGKVFAIAGWSEDDVEPGITFKVTELVFDALEEHPACRPAPYLASRGFTWIQCLNHHLLGDAELKNHLRESHQLVALKLSKRRRVELGLSF